MAPLLFKRQGSTCSEEDVEDGICDSDGNSYGSGFESFWWSSTGLAVRYAIVVCLFVIIVAFLLFAYFHALRRIRRGQEPLFYHRWLVRRRLERTQMYNTSAYQHQGAYPMQNFQPPPPVYSQFDAPPQYQPPAGGTKAMADQNVYSVHPEERVGESSNAAHAIDDGDLSVARPPPAHSS